MNFENLPVIILMAVLFVGLCVGVFAFVKFLKTPPIERAPKTKPIPLIWSMVTVVGSSSLGLWKIFDSESNIIGIVAGSIWLLAAAIILFRAVKNVQTKKT